jgi:hypothetical protein
MLWQRLKALSSLTMVLALLLAIGGMANHSTAATISYGTFGPVPPGVTFLDVEESSGTDAVPLYGPPDPFATGLDFDPTSFVATASGGAEDVTDGQLNFTVMGALGINSISLQEFGDYSLVGVGTATTQAIAGAIMRATVTQINGVNVAPINLTPVNASVGFNLLANPGVVQPWSLGTTLNVAAQMAGRGRATKVEVVINNQLLALSELSSLSFIAKKDFRITVESIPEPATALMAGLLCGGLGLVSVRRRD